MTEAAVTAAVVVVTEVAAAVVMEEGKRPPHRLEVAVMAVKVVAVMANRHGEVAAAAVALVAVALVAVAMEVAAMEVAAMEVVVTEAAGMAAAAGVDLVVARKEEVVAVAMEPDKESTCLFEMRLEPPCLQYILHQSPTARGPADSFPPPGSHWDIQCRDHSNYHRR